VCRPPPPPGPQVIKLSDAVQKLPHQVTCNVHGVSSNFLEVGRRKAAPAAPGEQRFTKVGVRGGGGSCLSDSGSIASTHCVCGGERGLRGYAYQILALLVAHFLLPGC
jgi:hypothetical protein